MLFVLVTGQTLPCDQNPKANEPNQNQTNMKKIRLTPRAYDALFNDKEPAVLQPRNTASKPQAKPSINNPFTQLQLIKP